MWEKRKRIVNSADLCAWRKNSFSSLHYRLSSLPAFRISLPLSFENWFSRRKIYDFRVERNFLKTHHKQATVRRGSGRSFPALSSLCLTILFQCSAFFQVCICKQGSWDLEKEQNRRRKREEGKKANTRPLSLPLHFEADGIFMPSRPQKEFTLRTERQIISTEIKNKVFI